MSKYLVLICLLLSTISNCHGQSITAICGNNINITVTPDADFPVDSADERANASGLVLGVNEYCDPSGVAPTPACEFHEVGNGDFVIEIEDFDTCGISTVYKSPENYTEVTMIVSRIPYMNSSVVRRSECGTFSVICRYDKTLENVTYETSVNITTHPYVGTNLTENATAEAHLHLVDSQPDGVTPTNDIAVGTVYNLTEIVYVEADIENNTDKFVATLYNCYASKTDDYDNDYELIDSDGCPNTDDGTVIVGDGNFPVTPLSLPYFEFEAFVWTTLEHTIYLQCDMDVCLDASPDCKNDMTKCGSKKLRNRFRRRTGGLDTRTVKSGPINVKNIQSKVVFSEE